MWKIPFFVRSRAKVSRQEQQKAVFPRLKMLCRILISMQNLIIFMGHKYFLAAPASSSPCLTFSKKKCVLQIPHHTHTHVCVREMLADSFLMNILEGRGRQSRFDKNSILRVQVETLPGHIPKKFLLLRAIVEKQKAKTSLRVLCNVAT